MELGDSEHVHLYMEHTQQSILITELEELTCSDLYKDTTLICGDGMLQTNAFLAALAFPELSSVHYRYKNI
jgi:hypothetical protein